MTTTLTTIATLTLDAETAKKYDDRDARFECAAWWQMHHAQPGAIRIATYDSTNYHRTGYSVEIPATTGEGYFPSLWCGVRISREPYDRTKHAGHASRIHRTFSARELLDLDEIELDADAYDAVLAQAIADAERDLRVAEDGLARDAGLSRDYYTRLRAERVANLDRLMGIEGDRHEDAQIDEVARFEENDLRARTVEELRWAADDYDEATR